MGNNMDKKILEEIARFNYINKYIVEQEATDPAALPPADPAMEALPPADPAMGALPPADPAMGATPPADPAMGATPPAPTTGQPVDVKADPDVEELDDKNVEEMDVTELVDNQKEIKSKQENYFETLFKQIENMESKLGEMDEIMSSLNRLEAKVEKYREKTPEEKLELRSLDSGPFKQKLSDFFIDKKNEMEQSGKNEYILTSDDVENYSPETIKQSFNPESNDDLMP